MDERRIAASKLEGATVSQFKPQLVRGDFSDSIANRGVGGKGDDVVVEMFRFCGRAGMDTGAAKATARLKGSF